MTNFTLDFCSQVIGLAKERAVGCTMRDFNADGATLGLLRFVRMPGECVYSGIGNIVLDQASFIIDAERQNRAVQGGIPTGHAYVHGTVITPQDESLLTDTIPVTYRPGEGAMFMGLIGDTPTPLSGAAAVILAIHEVEGRLKQVALAVKPIPFIRA